MRSNILSDINNLNDKLSRRRVGLNLGFSLNPNGLRPAITKLSEVADQETVYKVSKRCLAAMDSVILNVLKDGYYHAKLLGDFRNARICRDKLLEYSRKNSSRISLKDKEFIERLAPKRFSYAESLLKCEKYVKSLNELPDESNQSKVAAFQHYEANCYQTSEIVNPSYSSNSGVTLKENIHEVNQLKSCKTNLKPLQNEKLSTWCPNEDYRDLKLSRKNGLPILTNKQNNSAKPYQSCETITNNFNVMKDTVQPVKKISSMSDKSRPCALFKPVTVEQKEFSPKKKPERSQNSNVQLIKRRSRGSPKVMKNLTSSKRNDKKKNSILNESSTPVKKSTLKNAVNSTTRVKKRKRTNDSMCSSDINNSARARTKRIKRFSSTPLLVNKKNIKSKASKNKTTDSSKINTDTSEYVDTPKSTYSNRRGKYQILYKRRLFSSPRNSLDIYSNKTRKKIN